ncbi:MAG: hypothetical protein IJ122_04635 [Methanobrevibacter sp.]|nr:hypothetical protein [Methanobrevibacter sp.]
MGSLVEHSSEYDSASPSKPVKGHSSVNGCSHDEKLVWPWKGILVNIPTTRGDNGRSVGGNGSKLRDEFIMRGFNPKRVVSLWNYHGHSGTAIVEFINDWPGLHNAMSFEKAFEADHHGKKDWYAPNKEKSGLYAWVARSDDYNLNNVVGEILRNLGDLKTISEMMEEETRKQHQLLFLLIILCFFYHSYAIIISLINYVSINHYLSLKFQIRMYHIYIENCLGLHCCIKKLLP